MDFYDLDHEEIKKILRGIYDEYADDLINAEEDYRTDTRSAAKRNCLRRRQGELRTIERILEAIGLNFWED